jgi:hypothetical protein
MRPALIAIGTTKPNMGNFQPKAITVTITRARSHFWLKLFSVDPLQVAVVTFIKK